MTNREAISLFRVEVNERSADSSFTDKDLYHALMKQASWLIPRESNAGKIITNNSLFQPWKAKDIIEVSTIPACLSIKTNCKIYRTKQKVPDLWVDDNGPIVKRIISMDGSNRFFVIDPTSWENIKNDPYEKYSDKMYVFFSDGYFWFPEHNPHKATFECYFKYDLSLFPEDCSDCQKEKGCVRFLDTVFRVPDKLLGELFSYALKELLPAEQSPKDAQIDKNPNRKN